MLFVGKLASTTDDKVVPRMEETGKTSQSCWSHYVLLSIQCLPLRRLHLPHMPTLRRVAWVAGTVRTVWVNGWHHAKAFVWVAGSVRTISNMRTIFFR